MKTILLRRTLLLALALVLGLATLHAADQAPEAVTAKAGEPSRAPILVLAVDGLEWNLVLPFLREGRMPELRRLMGEGRFGLLRTLMPTVSPAIWTTVATGKSIAKHGIDGFRYKNPENPEEEILYSGLQRRTKAFWNILSDQGLGVHSIGWFLTYPAEEINGVMVAQTNTPLKKGDVRQGKGLFKGSLVEGVEGQVTPSGRQAEMLGHLHRAEAGLDQGLAEIFGEFRYPLDPLGASLWESCRWAFRADSTYLSIALALVEEPHDLLAVYIGGTDVVSHRFWRYMEPERYRHPPDARQVKNLGEVIPDYYAYVDGVLGRLREAYGREVTIIVLSDHGMRPVHFQREFGPPDSGRARRSADHGDAEPGVFVAAGPGIRGADSQVPISRLAKSGLPKVGGVEDITPTLLALLGVPVGEDMDGKVLTELLDPESLARRPVRTVATHDTPEWLASRPESGRASPDEEQRLEQLRALGYIE